MKNQKKKISSERRSNDLLFFVYKTVVTCIIDIVKEVCLNMRIKEPIDVVEFSVKLTWKIGTKVAGFALRNTLKAGKSVLKGTFSLSKKAAVFGFHKMKEKREERKRDVMLEQELFDYDEPIKKPVMTKTIEKEEEVYQENVISFKQKVEEKKALAEKEKKLPGTYEISNDFATLCKQRTKYYEEQAHKAGEQTDEFAKQRQENYQKMADLNYILSQAIMYDGGKEWDEEHNSRMKDFRDGTYQLNEGIQRWTVDGDFIGKLNKSAHFGEFSTEMQTYDNVMETTMADISKMNFLVDFAREKGDTFAEKYLTGEMNKYIEKNMDIIAEMKIKNEPLDKPYKDEYDYYSSIAGMQKSSEKDKEMRKTLDIKKAKGQGITDFAKVYMANKKEKEKQKQEAIASSKTTQYSKLQQASQSFQTKPKKTVDLSM